MLPDDIAIRAILDSRMSPETAAQVDAIFFEASGRTFNTPEERAAFRERWLGRYLRGGSDVFLLAQEPAGAVAGYLVGALADPATQERFADIAYFGADFRELCRCYPAHLHVNLAPAFRGLGVGARLIAAFADHAERAGVPGLHVVTAKAARNVRFYTRCGFAGLGTTWWNEREVVFLGKRLSPPGPA